MNPPKMPIHIGDYRRDTGHLRAAEHGAYLMLLFHYWSTGGLPNDDRQLSTIACMSPREWKNARPLIEPLFKDGWKHKRVDYDLEKARKVSEAASNAGTASAQAKAQRKSNEPSTDVQRETNEPSTSLLPSNHSNAADAAPSLEKELFERGKQVLGQDAGGLIAKLLKAKKKDVALARAAIETASTKQKPREYIGRVIVGNAENANDQHWGNSLIPGIS